MRHILLGFIDGLITASTLASSLIIRGAKISVYFAVSLSILVATINLINAFVAEYVHQRREAEEVYYKITLNDVKDIKWGYLKS
jgi:Na+-transporting methylmalonyl-CoA/oxaloacetate decarboxylase gamma subunit